MSILTGRESLPRDSDGVAKRGRERGVVLALLQPAPQQLRHLARGGSHTQHTTLSLSFKIIFLNLKKYYMYRFFGGGMPLESINVYKVRDKGHEVGVNKD